MAQRNQARWAALLAHTTARPSPGAAHGQRAATWRRARRTAEARPVPQPAGRRTPGSAWACPPDGPTPRRGAPQTQKVPDLEAKYVAKYVAIWKQSTSGLSTSRLRRGHNAMLNHTPKRCPKRWTRASASHLASAARLPSASSAESRARVHAVARSAKQGSLSVSKDGKSVFSKATHGRKKGAARTLPGTKAYPAQDGWTPTYDKIS